MSEKLTFFKLKDSEPVDFNSVKTPISVLQEKVKSDPHNNELWFNLGVEYATEGKVREAIDAFEASLRLKNDDHICFFVLGNLYLAIGQFEIAIRHFVKSIKFNETFSPAYFNTGICYTQLNLNDKATKSFKKFLVMHKGDRKWKHEAEFQLYKLGVYKPGEAPNGADKA